MRFHCVTVVRTSKYALIIVTAVFQLRQNSLDGYKSNDISAEFIHGTMLS